MRLLVPAKPAVWGWKASQLPNKEPEASVPYSYGKWQAVKSLLVQHAPLIGILLGSVLLSISLGPYSS